jgi:hypothetical protein
MKCTLKIATVVLMLGTTVATAQTPTQAQPFVERYRQMQSLVTFNPSLKPTPPVFRDIADAPIGHEPFAERFASMQQASANSPEPVFEAPPRPATVAADPVGNESFAERFREMQAASSNSGQFGFHPGRDDLASESPTSLVVAMPLRSVTRQ